ATKPPSAIAWLSTMTRALLSMLERTWTSTLARRTCSVLMFNHETSPRIDSATRVSTPRTILRSLVLRVVRVCDARDVIQSVRGESSCTGGDVLGDAS